MLAFIFANERIKLSPRCAYSKPRSLGTVDSDRSQDESKKWQALEVRTQSNERSEVIKISDGSSLPWLPPQPSVCSSSNGT